jgi:hypothetical protein
LKDLALEEVGIFCGHLVNVPAFWYMLWSFATFVVVWFIFPHFGMLYREKSGNPASRTVTRDRILKQFYFRPGGVV